MDVFTYGTLQVDAIWRRVTGQACRVVAGVAHGYRVRRLKDADYPAIVSDDLEDTPGLVYLDVAPDSLVRLDRFEGDQYVRRPLRVQCQDGQVRTCQAYVLAPSKLDLLTSDPWRLDEFINGPGLARFSNRYVGFQSSE